MGNSSDKKPKDTSFRFGEESDFRALIEKSSDVILVIDRDLKIFYASPSFKTIFGKDSDGYLGAPINDFFGDQVHSDDIDAVMETFERCLDKPKTECRAEFRFRHTDETWHNLVAVGTNHFDTPSIGGILINIRDITPQKKVSEALAASEIRYRRLFEAAKDGILILDAETGQIVDVNPFLTDLLGYSREEFFGKKIWEIGLFRDIAANEANFLELQEKGYVRYEDMPLETKDGRKINVEFVSNVYHIDNTKVIQCNIRDISQRKRHEAEIESLNSFLLSIRNLNQGIVQLEDFDQLLADSCRILAEIQGYVHVSIAFRDELDGVIRPRVHQGSHEQYDWEFSDDDDSVPLCIKRMLDTRHAFIMRQGEPGCAKCKFCPHESEHQSIIVPILGRSKELLGSITAILEPDRVVHPQEVPLFEEVAGDLAYAHEKLRGERALAESEERYRTLVETMQEGLWVIDADEKTSFVNPAMAEMLGYDVDEMMGRPLFDFMDQQGVELTKENLKRGREGLKENHDFEFIRKDGNRICTLIATSPLVDKDGNYQGAIAGVQDITQLKNAQNVLKQSEKKFREFFEGSRDGFMILDLKGTFLECNSAFQDMLGYTIDELRSMNFYQVTPEKWHEWERNEIVERKLMKDGYSGQFEKEYVRKDGTVFPVEMQSYAHRDEDGQVQFLWGVARDISERKKQLEELEEQNLFISTIIENFPLGLAINSIDSGATEYMNPAFERIFGWPKEEMKTLDDFFDKAYPDPEYRKELKEQVMADIQSGDLERMSWYGVRPTGQDGKVRIVDARNIPLPEQNLMISTAVDVTDKHAADQRMWESEERYRTLFEDSMDAVFITGQNGDIIDINQSGCELLGYEKDELLGQNALMTYVDDKDRQGLRDALEQEGTIKDHEVVLRKKDGGRIVCLISATVKKDDDGKIAGYQGIIHDITQMMTMMHMHREEYERAEFYNDLMGHDISNYNQGALSNLELLLMEKELPESVKKYAINALNQVDGSAKLISNLRKLSELKEGGMSKSALNVVPVLEEVIDKTRSTFPDKKMDISLDYETEDMLIQGNSLLIEAFFNILSNAVKFDRNETVKVDIRVSAEPPKHCKIEFMDRGPGIDDRMKDVIFDRMKRLEPSVWGTGIGLTLVKSIIENFGGDVSVLDRVPEERGRGSNFIITLPRGDAPG